MMKKTDDNPDDTIITFRGQHLPLDVQNDIKRLERNGFIPAPNIRDVIAWKNGQVRVQYFCGVEEWQVILLDASEESKPFHRLRDAFDDLRMYGVIDIFCRQMWSDDEEEPAPMEETPVEKRMLWGFDEWLESHGFKATQYGMPGDAKLIPGQAVVQIPVEWTDDFGVKVKVRWDDGETSWEAYWYYTQDFEGYGETPSLALSKLRSDIKRQYEDKSDDLRQWLAVENHLSSLSRDLNSDKQ